MNTKALRQKILDLAIHGKLVPQDPNDEPASVLLERIRAEKERLIKEGKIKKSKKAKAVCDKPHYPFELPKGWVWTMVGEISKSILYGVSESAKSEGEYKLLRITDIQNNAVDWDTVPYTDFDEHKANAYLINDGDILFARTGATVGKSYLVKGLQDKVIYASYLIRVQTFSEILPEYVKYFFESGFYWEQIQKSSVGIGQPNVNGTILSQLEIPIPPFDEQKRIVNELEAWLSIIDAIDNGKIELQIAIKLAKSKILDLAIHGKLVPQDPNDEPASELLKRINPKAEITCDTPQYGKLPKGWCSCTLKNVCSFTNGFAFSSDAYKNNGIPLVRISNITNEGRIDLNSCVYIQDEIDEPYIIEKGDLLVAMSGATTGKMGVYTYGEISYLNQRVGKIKASKALYTPYMHYLMYSQVDNILKMAYGGAQPNISAKAILAIRILLPPLAEQHRIVAKIEEIFAQLDKIESSL